MIEVGIACAIIITLVCAGLAAPELERGAPMRRPSLPLPGWRAAVLALVAALGLWGGLTAARSHAWYPPDCCSGHDCDVIAAERVRVTLGGYVVDGEHFVAMASVRHSPDGQYHGCFPNPKTMRCFWAPPSSS